MLNSLDIRPEDPTELREVSELLVSEVIVALYGAVDTAFV